MDARSGEHDAHYLSSDSSNDEPPRERNVLVLTDFSEKVHAALRYASVYAQKSGGELLLLHIADPQDNDRTQDLAQLVAEYSEAVKCNWLLSQGDFLTEVSAAVADFHAAMIVLSSQHLNTPELYKKSLARQLFKHLTGTYLLVQSMPTSQAFHRVLLPVDYTDKPDCQHTWLNLLKDYFSFDVHLVLPQVNESELQDTVEANWVKIRQRLDALSIPYHTHTVEGRDEYSQEILSYGRSVEADLLVINSMRTSEDSYLLESHERSLILHASELPVLVVNH